LSNQLADDLQDVFNHWSRVRVTDSEVKKLIQLAMAPNKETTVALRNGRLEELSSLYKNTVENVFEYAQSAPSQQEETAKGTLFGCYNAITGFYQNVKGYQNEESKFKSIMYGTGLQKGQKAFDLCTDFAKLGSEILN
jgi:hypothetical protein